jgi:hypothetical protein
MSEGAVKRDGCVECAIREGQRAPEVRLDEGDLSAATRAPFEHGPRPVHARWRIARVEERGELASGAHPEIEHRGGWRR